MGIRMEKFSALHLQLISPQTFSSWEEDQLQQLLQIFKEFHACDQTRSSVNPEVHKLKFKLWFLIHFFSSPLSFGVVIFKEIPQLSVSVSQDFQLYIDVSRLLLGEYLLCFSLCYAHLSFLSWSKNMLIEFEINRLILAACVYQTHYTVGQEQVAVNVSGFLKAPYPQEDDNSRFTAWLPWIKS